MDKVKLLYSLTFCASLIIVLLWIVFFVPSAQSPSQSQDREEGIFMSLKKTIKENLQNNHSQYSFLIDKIAYFTQKRDETKLFLNRVQEQAGLSITAKELRQTQDYLLAVMEIDNASDFNVFLPSVVYLADTQKEPFSLTPEIQPDDFLYLPLKRELKTKEKTLGIIVFPDLPIKHSLKIFFKGIVQGKNCFAERSNCPKLNFLLNLR